ncbi:MAG TPA: class I SAM-dependent methyltransferase [Bacteroidota bacterium]|nr:class I SAM-dependent methyltransferase [Bacteroidota bacterium]
MKQSTKQNWESFWKQKENVHEYYSNSDRILRNLSRITDLKGKKVLEIGAGTGRDSLNFVQHGAEVYQLDYAMNALKLMKDVATETGMEIHLIGGDAFGLPFEEGTFDIVFHQGLLEHFREPAATNLLKENVRVLKKNGLLVVDVPQRYHVYTVMKHILIWFNAWFAGWEREFSVGELEKKLRGLGLKTVYAYGEWMYPSLFYRVTREAFYKIGIRLPLHPKLFEPLSRLRASIRESLMKSRLALYTQLSIGVVAEKP